MSVAMLLFIALSTLAAGGLAYALMEPRLRAEKKVETRRSQFTRNENEKQMVKATRDRLQEQAKRRKNIQSSIKDMEARTKEREKHAAKLTLARQLEQSGAKIGVRGFVWLSVFAGVLALLIAVILGLSLLASAAIAVIAGLGLPRFVLSQLRKRRLHKFTEEFPNGIDLIVRGVKSGLPLNDTLRMVAGEAAEPVAGEFRKIVEAQQMGVTTPEAVERLYRAVPTSETNFFSIVISIQAQAGGNLSEALGNLSRVLRDRKKMKAKIQAMSMEAKASGFIIGSLPIIVGLLVYVTTPDYITVLFVTPTGHIILVASAIWMGLGIFVMKRMINFDF